MKFPFGGEKPKDTGGQPEYVQANPDELLAMATWAEAVWGAIRDQKPGLGADMRIDGVLRTWFDPVHGMAFIGSRFHNGMNVRVLYRDTANIWHVNDTKYLDGCSNLHDGCAREVRSTLAANIPMEFNTYDYDYAGANPVPAGVGESVMGRPVGLAIVRSFITEMKPFLGPHAPAGLSVPQPRQPHPTELGQVTPEDI